MRAATDAQMDKCGPKSGLGVISVTACGAYADPIKGDIIARRASSQAALVERFREANRDGDLPDHVDPENLTLYLYAILRGMAVQSGCGATRAELERVVETSLIMWPPS